MTLISYRFLFNKNHLSKEWDVFGCFTVPDFEPNELFPMDPSGTKKYTEEDEDGSAGAAAAAATAAAKVTIGKKINKQCNAFIVYCARVKVVLVATQGCKS